MSENRPEWGISYFAILLAGAAVVPLDKELTLAEVQNLAKVSGAKALVLSRKVAERLAGEANLAVPVGDDEDDVNVVWSPAHTALDEFFGKQLEPRVLAFDELLTEPDVSVGAVRPEVKGDSLASLIFTSGTTGTPKGVMLTHKNLTSMVSKLSSLFTLYKHDKLLSVLPLHHTFEFSAGLPDAAHARRVDRLPRGDRGRLARARARGRGRHRHGRRAGAVAAARAQDLQERRATRACSSRRRSTRSSSSTARCATSCRGTSAPASCCSSRCTASSAAACACSSRAARRCRPTR